MNAEISSRALLNQFGSARRSIHHMFASNPAVRRLPNKLSSEKPPKNRAKPRGKASLAQLTFANEVFKIMVFIFASHFIPLLFSVVLSDRGSAPNLRL